AVGQHEGRVVPELLDETENVVPTAAIQAGRVLPQLVEDFVHFKSGQNRLDQDGGADGAAGDAEFILRVAEDVVPQASFEMALQLGEIEVGAGSLTDETLRVVKQVKTEIKQRSGDGRAVHFEMPFHQMPASRPHQQRCHLGIEVIALP